MSRRALMRWMLPTAILAMVVSFAIWLEPTRVVWGWLRGEDFYKSRPTSWWASELSRWEMLTVQVYSMWGDRPAPPLEVFRRSPHAVWEWSPTWLRSRFGPEPSATVAPPAILQGDAAAQPMLRVLVENEDAKIRELARHGLEQIEAHTAWNPQVTSQR